MMANITVFAVAYLLFHVQAGEDDDPLSDTLGPADVPIFRVRRPSHNMVIMGWLRLSLKYFNIAERF